MTSWHEGLLARVLGTGATATSLVMALPTSETRNSRRELCVGVMVNGSPWVLKVVFGKRPTSGQGPPGGPSGEPGFPSARSAKLHLELGESRQLDAEGEGQVSTEMMRGAEPSPAQGKGGATLGRNQSRNPLALLGSCPPPHPGRPIRYKSLHFLPSASTAVSHPSTSGHPRVPSWAIPPLPATPRVPSGSKRSPVPPARSVPRSSTHSWGGVCPPRLLSDFRLLSPE